MGTCVGVALVLFIAVETLQLDRGSYGVFLLILLGLVVRYLELHRREGRLARELSGLNAELRQAFAESQALTEISKEISGQVQLDVLLDLVACRARGLLGADTASVAAVREDTGDSVWVSAVGFQSSTLKGTTQPSGKGLAGMTMASGRPFVVADLRCDPAIPPEESPFHRAEGVVSALAVPLARGDRALGALVVGFRQKHDFAEREIALLSAMAGQASVAIENARLYGMEMRKAAEMEAVIQHMSDGVIICDREGRVVQRNQAIVSLLGEVRVGDTLLDLVARVGVRMETPNGRSLPTEKWPMVRASRGERFIGQEVVVRRPDNSVRHLLADGCPVVNEKDDVVLSIAVMHDVTAAREMEELRDEFLSLAAHELKTPLTPLKGYAQLLLRDGEGLQSRGRHALEVISRQVDRINRIVEQFLRVAEIRSGRLSLRPERLDLAAVAASTCENLRESTSGCPVVCHISAPTHVVADRRSLELVLTNLLHNAVKFSPCQGQVEVEVATSGADAVVCVRDRGVGIPKEKQRHIFERFYQVQPGTSSQGGVGLGLYISEQLIERQGGRMWLESEEGVGSSFYFSLPIADGHRDANRQPLPGA